MRRREDYYTTGEVAALLSISRSTVSRRFDTGVLQGKVNAITGERLISAASLVGFVHDQELPVDLSLVSKKHIMLCSADPDLLEAVQQIGAGDERVVVEVVTQGSYALVKGATEQPDLLIVDESLPDMECRRVIASLREVSPAGELKILVFLRAHEHNVWLDWGADAYVSRGGCRDGNHLRARIYDLLNMPREPTFEDAPVSHRRRWKRFPVEIPMRVAMYARASPEKLLTGTAVMVNVSQGGACLVDILMADGVMPAVPFRVSIESDTEPLADWRAECRVVRLATNGSVSAGLAFAEIQEESRKSVLALAMK